MIYTFFLPLWVSGVIILYMINMRQDMQIQTASKYKKMPSMSFFLIWLEIVKHEDSHPKNNSYFKMCVSSLLKCQIPASSLTWDSEHTIAMHIYFCVLCSPVSLLLGQWSFCPTVCFLVKDFVIAISATFLKFDFPTMSTQLRKPSVSPWICFVSILDRYSLLIAELALSSVWGLCSSWKVQYIVKIPFETLQANSFHFWVIPPHISPSEQLQ